ncbi:hypothetical protein JTB14_021660 [Gonioctena quinquepunctata]|nr:hypothetical protein JTB14_021660 [Gonioctena quinquepunctata]
MKLLKNIPKLEATTSNIDADMPEHEESAIGEYNTSASSKYYKGTDIGLTLLLSNSKIIVLFSLARRGFRRKQLDHCLKYQRERVTESWKKNKIGSVNRNTSQRWNCRYRFQ